MLRSRINLLLLLTAMLTACGGTTTTTWDNCQSSADCPPGYGCSLAAGGVCYASPPCNAGFTNCGGLCVDVKNDRSYCGSCGKVCGSGADCDTATFTCKKVMSSTP